MTQLPTYSLGYAIEQENNALLQANGMEPALMLKSAAANFPAFNTNTDPMAIITLLDQANQGACQGFALARMFQICYFLMTGQILDFSAAAAYYLSQRYDGIRGDFGSTLSGGQKVATIHGLCLAKEWAYPSRYYNVEPTPKPNYAFKLVAAKPTKDPGLIREALDLGLPVQDGITWNNEVSQTVCDNYTGRGAGGGHSTCLWLKKNGNYIRINSWGKWDGDGCNENTPKALDQQVRLSGNNHVIYAPEGMIYPDTPPIPLPTA
jgi:hypothetical protein